MSLVAAVISFVIGLMLAEARVSRANERTLLARGAVAPPGDIYPVMALVYPAAFLAMAAEGLWRASNGTAAAAGGPNWFVSGVLLFAASKALKYWAIRSLGDRWTFKVIVEPGRPLVTSGPYRYVAHPNYVAVAGELVSTAMMCGASVTGIGGLAAFGAVLWRRVRFESDVLSQMAGSR